MTDSAVRGVKRVIRFGSEEGHAVRLIGRMPLLSSRELSDILDLGGYPAARKMMENLEALGHIKSVKAAGVRVNGWPVKRFVLTSKGIRRMAAIEGIGVATAMRRYPVSLQWRRSLLKRVESLELYYKVCCYIALARREGKFAVDVARNATPVFHWRRTGWLDGTIGLDWGKNPPGIRVMRLGSSSVRRAMLHRMGTMVESWLAGGVERVLIVVPGHTELRLIEGWLRQHAGAVQAFCVVESELRDASVWTDLKVSRPLRYGSVAYGVAAAFGDLKRRSSYESRKLDECEKYDKPILPGMIMLRNGRLDREIMAGVSLSRTERATLQVVSDWPLALRSDLIGMAGVVKDSLSSLVETGLVFYVWDNGRARCLLSDAGNRYLAGRDRSSLGALRQRWSYVFVRDGDEVPAGLPVFPVTGYGVGKGARLRAEAGKLRAVSRQLEHLDGITRFMSLYGKGREDFDLIEALPTHRSERWTGRGRDKKAILPDASFIASVKGEVLPFVLEFERRADKPSSMAERLTPYKQYYDDMFSYEDLGKVLTTLFLFDDKIKASDFSSYCFSGRAATRTERGRTVPLYVSSSEVIEDRGCWADVWLAIGGRFGGRYMSLSEIAS